VAHLRRLDGPGWHICADSAQASVATSSSGFAISTVSM
jgi:hypothetical protein